jgi:hypothetical protein
MISLYFFQERIKDHGRDHQGDKKDKDKVQAGRNKIIGGNFEKELGKKGSEGAGLPAGRRLQDGGDESGFGLFSAARLNMALALPISS